LTVIGASGASVFSAAHCAFSPQGNTRQLTLLNQEGRMTEVLKYGAMGIGLAVLVYTAALLRQELAKPEPRVEARRLILIYMAFSLIAFGIAAFIELREKSMAADIDMREKTIKADFETRQQAMTADFDARQQAMAAEAKRLASRVDSIATANFGAVQLDIGYFANVVDICGQGIAITTDGIGSKAMIASELGKYDSIGIDCVAMNVNDLICVGAKPVSMVDYLAVEKVDAEMLDAISVGLCAGAELAGISISGGETAQLKGMIHGFDLTGTAIGHVPLDKILVGQDIQEGDVLIGVESNGIHSNGLSLARRAFFEKKTNTSSRTNSMN
jgi:AIR synthase related protein, N-terminal domain